MTELSSKRARARARNILRFCAEHGIDVNKETVYLRVLAWDAIAAKYRRKPVESEEAAQLRLALPPKAQWEFK